MRIIKILVLKSGVDYIIGFKGLEDGEHLYAFQLNDSFFKNLEYSEIEQGTVDVNIKLIKQPGILNFELSLSGKVSVVCDRCLDRYLESAFFNDVLIVKLGNVPEDLEEDSEVLYLDFNAFEIDLGHYIYESIILSLPFQKVHPVGNNGKSTCNKEMIERLEKLASESKNEDIDPRWDVLKNLNNN